MADQSVRLTIYCSVCGSEHDFSDPGFQEWWLRHGECLRQQAEREREALMLDGALTLDITKDLAEKMGQALFTDPEDDWNTTLFVENDREMLLTTFRFEDRASIEAAKVIIPMMLIEAKAKRAALLMSTWQVAIDAEREDDAPIPAAEDVRKHLPDMPPSQHPDRKEALFITYVDAETLTGSTADIIRDGVNPPTLGEWDDFEGVNLGGEFAHVLRAGITLAAKA